MKLDQPLVAAAAQISPVFMKKKESIEKSPSAFTKQAARASTSW